MTNNYMRVFMFREKRLPGAGLKASVSLAARGPAIVIFHIIVAAIQCKHHLVIPHLAQAVTIIEKIHL